MKRLGIVVVIASLMAVYINACIALAAPTEAITSTWSQPSLKALKRVGELPSEQQEPNFLNNTDCVPLDYRFVNSSSRQTGCFAETAFGLMEDNTVIFNGTDEALPLISPVPHQVLIPWPKAGQLIALDALDTGGSYISLYTNPTGNVQDVRDYLFRLTAKKLTRPPNLQLTDLTGQRLVINPQTIAFSDGGSWLVAETLSGSFVRINVATLDVTAFAPSFTAAGHPNLFQSQVAVSANGRYVAISNYDYQTFKVYDLTKCTDIQTGLKPAHCASYDYLDFVRGQVSGVYKIRHVRFINNELLGFHIWNTDASKSAAYLLAPTAEINSLIDYLALGDSYTSGEGAFNYLFGTDTPDNVCHLSALSYPMLLTRDLFTTAGGQSVACSGAVIQDIASTSGNYRGQARGSAPFSQRPSNEIDRIMADFSPGYLAQHRFAAYYQPKIITVSIAGNDVGFGNILEQCLTPRLSHHHSDNDCFGTYEDRLEVKALVDRTVSRWTNLYAQLSRAAPLARIYAIGYPDVALETGDCALNVQLSKGELLFARELIDYINNSMHRAADKAGVSYVDITKALKGHRLCETASHNVAVNGVTAGKDVKVLGVGAFGHESYHPNAHGHELIERYILKQTKNLTTGKGPTAHTNNNFLKGLQTSRTTYIRQPATGLTTKTIKPGAVQVTYNSTEVALRASSTYQIRLDGPNGQLLGSVMTDSSGVIDSPVTLSAGTTPGGHTIDIVGDNQTNEPIYITQPVYIPERDEDYDGDGLPNETDSCPTTTNSGQDVDQDGQDDACDGFIGLPTVPITAGTAITVQTHPINTTPAHGNYTGVLAIRPIAGIVDIRPKTPAPMKRPATAVKAHLAVRQLGLAKNPHWSSCILIWLIWTLIALLVLITIVISAKKLRRSKRTLRLA